MFGVIHCPPNICRKMTCHNQNIKYLLIALNNVYIQSVLVADTSGGDNIIISKPNKHLQNQKEKQNTFKIPRYTTARLKMKLY